MLCALHQIIGKRYFLIFYHDNFLIFFRLIRRFLNVFFVHYRKRHFLFFQFHKIILFICLCRCQRYRYTRCWCCRCNRSCQRYFFLFDRCHFRNRNYRFTRSYVCIFTSWCIGCIRGIIGCRGISAFTL